MLIYKENSDIFSLFGKALKGLLYGSGVGFWINYQEVLLSIWGRSDMLSPGVSLKGYTLEF
jgi:hypothetical protein